MESSYPERNPSRQAWPHFRDEQTEILRCFVDQVEGPFAEFIFSFVIVYARPPPQCREVDITTPICLMEKSRLEEVNFFPQFYTDEKGGARFKAACVGHQSPPLSTTVQ